MATNQVAGEPFAFSSIILVIKVGIEPTHASLTRTRSFSELLDHIWCGYQDVNLDCSCTQDLLYFKLQPRNFGGEYEIRTRNLLLAKQVLSRWANSPFYFVEPLKSQDGVGADTRIRTEIKRLETSYSTIELYLHY